MKNKKVIIRTEEDFMAEYFKMCDNMGYTMSKRIRRFMELDKNLNDLNLNLIIEIEKIIKQNA